MTIAMDPPVYYSKSEFIETVRPTEFTLVFVLTDSKVFRTQETKSRDALRLLVRRILFLVERLSYPAEPLSVGI